LFILPQYNKNGIRVQNAILLGRERSGQYAGEYNLCGGKMDYSDGGCVIKAIIREIMEEFKMDVRDKQVFDSYFRGSNGFIRCFTKGPSLIFVGSLPNGFSRQPIKHQMIHDCKNHSDYSYREMDDAEYFDSYNLRQIEGMRCEVSSYAKSVIEKALQKNFI
jgi:8-oxo-dGTP pyrophosphatase MutT (NUDIX family)